MLICNDTERIEIKYDELILCHREIIRRIITRLIEHFYPDKMHPVRLEDVERLVLRMNTVTAFRGATLAGCIFRKKKNVLLVMREAGH